MLKGCVVQKQHDFFNDYEFQQYGELDVQGIRNVLLEAARVNLDVLILGLDVSPDPSLLAAVHTYRVIRPKTRIVVLAPGRLPGDKTITDLVAMGIYDIVSGDDMISELQRALNSTSATYARAVRWTAKVKDEPELPPKKSLFNRIFRRRPKSEKHGDNDPFEKDMETAMMPSHNTEPSSWLKVVNKRVLLLGNDAQSLAATIKNLGWEVTFQMSDDYDIALADPDTYTTLPEGKQIFVLGAGIDLFFSSEQIMPTIIPVASKDAIMKILHKRLNTSVVTNQGVVTGFYSGAQGWQGKTVLALNTAAILASEGHAVCIVDLDTDKAGLTLLAGWDENVLPSSNLWSSIVSSTGPIKGPGDVYVIPARLDCPGWSPSPVQVSNLINKLAAQYDYVFLDFGARVASPSTIAALKQCRTVFIVSTPFRGALSAVARFRGKEMAEIGKGKVRAVINRVGAEGAISPKDAAAILGFAGEFTTVPEDPAFVTAETKALNGKQYVPPVLGRKCKARNAVQKLAKEIQKNQGVIN